MLNPDHYHLPLIDGWEGSQPVVNESFTQVDSGPVTGAQQKREVEGRDA